MPQKTSNTTAGQHGEPPSRGAWGVKAYRCRKGAAWWGRAGRNRRGTGEEERAAELPAGLSLFLPLPVGAATGTDEGGQHGLGGSGQELSGGAEPQASRQQSLGAGPLAPRGG